MFAFCHHFVMFGGVHISKKLKIAYAITISVIILTVAFMLFITSGISITSPTKTPNNPGTDNSATPGEPNQGDIPKPPDSEYMTISMSVNPVLRNGEADLKIYNDPSNEHAQVVEIYEDSTNELLYRSGYIPVGYSISSAPLLKSLPAGDYACTAIFQSVDSNTGELFGKAAAQIRITVVN